MNAASDQHQDLTSTIHLTSLRSVQGPVQELLSKSDPEVLKVLNQLDEESAMLVALIGPNRGARFLLNENSTSIGRATDADIFLDDVTVSRKHCIIEKSDNSGKRIFKLKDSGSLNGSYINGALVADALLSDGDEVQIGKFRMHFFSGGKSR
jgi:pSer/pThr/pTyr-binding forkhead associated (FHA) protein